MFCEPGYRLASARIPADARRGMADVVTVFWRTDVPLSMPQIMILTPQIEPRPFNTSQ